MHPGCSIMIATVLSKQHATHEACRGWAIQRATKMTPPAGKITTQKSWIGHHTSTRTSQMVCLFKHVANPVRLLSLLLAYEMPICCPGWPDKILSGHPLVGAVLEQRPPEYLSRPVMCVCMAALLHCIPKQHVCDRVPGLRQPSRNLEFRIGISHCLARALRGAFASCHCVCVLDGRQLFLDAVDVAIVGVDDVIHWHQVEWFLHLVGNLINALHRRIRSETST
eukprot:365325-Chlamydomonas_euryale.AAC.28